MSPQLDKGNLVIAESGIAARPRDYVVARVGGEPMAIVRRFRVGETSNARIKSAAPRFENDDLWVHDLVPNNGDFLTKRFAFDSDQYSILGVVVEIRWLRDVS